MLQWATLTVRSHKATCNCNSNMLCSVAQLKSKSFAAAHSVVQLAQMQHALPLRALPLPLIGAAISQHIEALFQGI